ncbi:site-specific recombinase, phage integrase family [Anaerococcus tetradius ATCC 35098]|uniref:Site-specific recombinase, phage integrase family n=1 Tax=Anaerococcus tetradius ATCC 35098 TaxID=525255 RepID=C2CIU4_9FIRM|nr:site-specific recombinase, phage integrase family [Anaerococcus tetradius ATCC 35098]
MQRRFKLPAFRDESGNKTWFCKFNYTNWRGEKLTKKKRGFLTKKEALKWEKEFLNQHSESIEMSFREFFELYKRDRKPRIRENTWRTKEAIVNQKILPYIGDLMLNEINNVTIIQWQNELMKIKDNNGKKYSPTYLRTIHAQLSSILNHACRYYNLKTNVARDVGSMGEKEADEMLFWTQDEYERFIEAIKDKPESFYAFELLYWCGLRMGELLALTKEKFDFKKHTLKIDESLQRIDGKNVITAPKTKKSIRTIVMPEFLTDEIKEYIDSFYKIKPKDLIFNFSKSYLHHEMDRGSKKSQVKRIRIHDLRHSHVSLLIELGFSATAIADRVGHESIDITYRYAHLFPSKQKEMALSLTQVRNNKANDWKDLLEEDEKDV